MVSILFYSVLFYPILSSPTLFYSFPSLPPFLLSLLSVELFFYLLDFIVILGSQLENIMHLE